ncbi:hypothetical protein TNIN_348781 [Trichonephila inaurata madagascariensis]|uniref:Uncharacterized protein n=1 Tax=Trichonephila inaurata madagascariensis TaxID=2747483 RepID=A0A8X7CCT4_9ARAC|nr:hypothetical protein TNIN_348781 [Trichonephila inaurata madagascariensis]
MICSLILCQYHSDDQQFIDNNVTEDETWLNHFTSTSKTPTMEWKYAGSLTRERFKVTSTAGEVMSKVKTAPNCVSVKKDGLHMKGDQRTVTISPVVKVHVELQHPSELPELEDGLKRLEKPDSMI